MTNRPVTPDEIRAWREAHGWSMRRLAQALGLRTHMTVWRWELPPDDDRRRPVPGWLRPALRGLEHERPDDG